MLKTQLFAFHAQKRTHTSTQQDDYKIAIRIDGLNILNAASGSGQRERACSVSMGSCKVYRYNCILSGL